MGLIPVQLEQPPESEGDDLNTSILDNLGAHLHGKYVEWKDARRDIEDEWLKDLRAYNGIYEANIAAKLDIEETNVFVHLTRLKVRTAYARLVDLLFGKDKHWSIDPSPVPSLIIAPEWDPEATAQAASEAMEQEIDDQLLDLKYEALVKQAMLEATIIGSGAIKGVTTETKIEQTWRQGPDGWGLGKVETPFPGLTGPSVFDLYPDSYATEVDEASGIFERHILTRGQLLKLEDHPGFDADAIAQVIREFPTGNHMLLDHETERRRIAGYNLELGKSNRYEVMEYWGAVSGDDLESAGLEIEDTTREYQANVWICGPYTIKARLSQIKPERLPYNIFPFEKVPHQLWGVGVAKQMRDSQTVLNAATRRLLGNMAISSGPQVEINKDLLAPGQTTDMLPWKKWLREGGDPQYPLLRFYHPVNIVDPLYRVIELFRKFADEETALPSYTHGEVTPGMTKTASGLSMLMGAASIVMKSVIKNVDDYLIKPVIESMYNWNMTWNDNPRIKGDMQVRARGSTALVAKEVQSQRTIQFAAMTANPIDVQLTDRREILRSVANSMELDSEKMIPDEQTNGAAGPGDPGVDFPPSMGGDEGIPVEPPGAVPGQFGDIQRPGFG